MECHVCDRPIESALVRVEVVERDRPAEIAWGPVAVHEGCERAVVTPFDRYLDAGYVRTASRLAAAPVGAGLGMHALDA
jgi:hypothetical protein